MTQVKTCENARTTTPHPAQPRGQGSNVVQLPPLRFPTEAARLRLAASHRDECAECIQMAMACFLGLAAMLFVLALLRDAGGQSDIAHYIRECLGFLAAAASCATLLAVCLALVHFIRFRQV